MSALCDRGDHKWWYDHEDADGRSVDVCADCGKTEVVGSSSGGTR
jgi:hypothetical protein